MKKKTNRKPTRSRFTLLRQLCNLIPNHLVPGLARQYDAEAKSRTFKPWSHVVSLIYAQLTHALGLNDVCDALRLNTGPLSAIRGATSPSKNALSHANRERDAGMAEALFWKMLEELQRIAPQFGSARRPRFAFRFKRMIHVVDSTTIQLVARCMDWAKHRRRKAAAKCHVRLNLQSLLPHFAIVDTAREHDNVRARELCAGVRAGEIVIFDKAYVDFDHLADLAMREVFWVTRAKDNLEHRVVRKFQRGRVDNILADELIELTGAASHKAYPNWMRRVVALVEINGELREMVFLTNNVDLERPDHRRPLSLPVEHRGLLQGTQADPAVGRFHGPQRQCRAVASVDRSAGLSVVALLRLSQPVGPQFHTALCSGAFGPVAKARTYELVGSLWDSRWRWALSGNTAASLFARSELKLWDSRSPYNSHTTRNLKLAGAFTRRFSQEIGRFR
jgi:uncharacterized protein DUF4372/DDE family transposase